MSAEKAEAAGREGHSCRAGGLAGVIEEQEQMKEA